MIFRGPVPIGDDTPLVWDRVVNPAMAWSQLAFRYRGGTVYRESPYEDENPDGLVRSAAEVWPSLLGVLVYAMLSWAFYELAVRSFEREGR